jgi:hypothetical protein
LIRYIRVLGALLGGSIGLVLATTGNGLFRDYDASGALIALWVVAWMVVGFGVLPYLTVVPATWLIRRVEALDRRIRHRDRRPDRLRSACCWGCRLAAPDPLGTRLPLGVSISWASACRPDGREAAGPPDRRAGPLSFSAAAPDVVEST